MRSIGGASCIHCPNKYSESWNKIQPVTWMVQKEYSTYTRTVYHGIHSIRDVGLVYIYADNSYWFWDSVGSRSSPQAREVGGQADRCKAHTQHVGVATTLL